MDATDGSSQLCNGEWRLWLNAQSFEVAHAAMTLIIWLQKKVQPSATHTSLLFILVLKRGDDTQSTVFSESCSFADGEDMFRSWTGVGYAVKELRKSIYLLYDQAGVIQPHRRRLAYLADDNVDFPLCQEEDEQVQSVSALIHDEIRPAEALPSQPDETFYDDIRDSLYLTMDIEGDRASVLNGALYAQVGFAKRGLFFLRFLKEFELGTCCGAVYSGNDFDHSLNMDLNSVSKHRQQ